MDILTVGIATCAFTLTGLVFLATTTREERCHQERRSMVLNRVHREPSLTSASVWSCPGFVDGYGFGRAGGSWLLS